MPETQLVRESEWEEPEWEEPEWEEPEEDIPEWEEPEEEIPEWYESDWEEPESEEPESEEPESEEPQLEEPQLEQLPLTLEGEMKRPNCLEGAPGHLRWKQGGCYFDNASGAASIALVATRMLRTMFYHSDVLTALDVQEIASFLNFVGCEEDIRKYVNGLDLVGPNADTGSSPQFSGLFKKYSNPTL